MMMFIEPLHRGFPAIDSLFADNHGKYDNRQ
jgi:hypothetical protein